MIVFIVTMLITGIIYACSIALLVYGWRKLNSFGPDQLDGEKTAITVSVVIAVRNEEHNISGCLHDLLHQDFHNENYEIIVVDDHSTDNTAREIQKVSSLSERIKMISLAKSQDESMGKKAALVSGILKAKGDLIVTTDADCRLPATWLQSLVVYYETCKPVMISAPVVFAPQTNFCGKFYELEFIGLVVAGAGAIGLKMPLMCNGANLAFSRHSFLEFHNSGSGKSWASGDDMFLMHWIRKNYGARVIHFLKYDKAVVSTRAPENIREFLRQRIRWSSKTKAYPGTFTAFIASIVLLNSVMLIGGTILLFFSPHLVYPVIAGWMLKFISDRILLGTATDFFRRRNLLNWFVLFQVMQVIYVVIVAFKAGFSGNRWKGRKC